jgi:DNA-directed RNA polymerase specialized sigma24 family protein
LVTIEDADVERELDRPIQPVEHEVLRRAQVQDVLQALDALPREYASPLRLVPIDQRSYAGWLTSSGCRLAR